MLDIDSLSGWPTPKSATLSRPLRITVCGAGAIGSVLAARLAVGGADVALLARNKRADQVESDGLTVESLAGEIHARPAVVRPGEQRDNDVLFLATKAEALAELVPTIQALSDDHTMIVPLCNGVPWWYFHGQESNEPLVRAVDPDGSLFFGVPAGQIVGSVVLLRCALAPDGRLRSESGERLILGDIVETRSTRCEALAGWLRRGGVDVTVSADVRRDVWSKVALNLATNPLSVVTGATLHDMFHDGRLSDVIAAILGETMALAEAYGRRPNLDIDQLMTIGRTAGHFMTSMAQDFGAGRPLELGSIVRAPLELAARVGLAMPVARAIARLAEQKAVTLKC